MVPKELELKEKIATKRKTNNHKETDEFSIIDFVNFFYRNV